MKLRRCAFGGWRPGRLGAGGDEAAHAALLPFRVPLAGVALALVGVIFSLGMAVQATPLVLFFLADGLVGYFAATRPRRVSVPAAVLPVGVVAGYYRQDELAIEIIDLGCGGTSARSGYGIAGMKERVSLLRGQFSAGPRPEGGFSVAARLPMRVEAGQ
jgi:hypothetical protein